MVRHKHLAIVDVVVNEQGDVSLILSDIDPDGMSVTSGAPGFSTVCHAGKSRSSAN